MALKIIIPPIQEPVTLEEAKAHLRIDGADEDNFISSLITAAREYAEGFQRRAYITQTWELWLDNWPDKNYISIPLPPLQTVTSVKYFDAGTEYTLSESDYFVDDKTEPGRVILAHGRSWPSVRLRPANGVAVQFTAGYDEAKIPQRVKQAILLLIGHWYENREASISGTINREIEFTVNALLWQDRVILL